MKKLTRLLIAAVLLVAVCATMLAGCGSSTPITIWVGAESVDFYQAKANAYIEQYNAAHDKKFPAEIIVKAADTSAAAAKFLDDTQAGPDIFTIPHDNLGKLTAGSSAIAPITDEALLAQIKADNPESFLDVITSSVQGTEYTFGVPYIAQALVLFYNGKYLSEEDVKTWEGILAVATANGKQALSLMGKDGYNNSFLTIARNLSSGEIISTIYGDKSLEDCDFTNDEVTAVLRWGQRFFTDPNGAKMPTDSGFEIELRDEISLCLIGGAWKFNAAKAALGDNMRIALLPTFTLSESDVEGTAVAAGTQYQSGTFADCKMFVIKKNSPNAAYLQDIVKFFSSSAVQQESFTQCQNLPAYKNALAEFTGLDGEGLEVQLAKCQIAMFEKGIPQPFGASTAHNFYFYSKGAPDLINEILTNKDSLFGTKEAIEAQCRMIENVWKTGNKE